MNLGLLLEEKNNIKTKINSAIYKIKVWFENKMDEAKETMTNVKINIFNKIKEKLSNIKKDNEKFKISYVDSNGKLITVNKTADKIALDIDKTLEKLVSEIIDNCRDIIKLCKDAILKLSTLDNKEIKKINQIKIEIKKKFSQIAIDIQVLYSNNKALNSIKKSKRS